MFRQAASDCGRSVSADKSAGLRGSPVWCSRAADFCGVETVVNSTSALQLRRNLAAIRTDGFAFSLMVGLGETWIPAFVLAAGFGEYSAAMVASVPILLGSILQLLAPAILYRAGQYRRFVVAAAVLQACSMGLLCGLSLAGQFPVWLVFLASTVYWTAGLSTGPAWNTWVEHLVPTRIRAKFLAARSRWCHLGVSLGLCTAGLLLGGGVHTEAGTTVFAGLFAAGTAARLWSAFKLVQQTDARACKVRLPEEATVALQLSDRIAQVISQIRHPGPVGRFVVFLLAMQVAVHISGPWFTPFMLSVRKLDWLEYMLLITLGFLGKILALNRAAVIATRFGSSRLLWIGSIGIVPMSSLWLVSQSVIWLGCVQVFSGIMWGCYELAVLLHFFGRIPQSRRVAVLTLYNLGNSAALVLGSCLGGALLSLLGTGYTSWLMVFLASSVVRLGCLLLLPGATDSDSTLISTPQLLPYASRTVAVRPMAGSLERPVLSAMAEGGVASAEQRDQEMDSARRSAAV